MQKTALMNATQDASSPYLTMRTSSWKAASTFIRSFALASTYFRLNWRANSKPSSGVTCQLPIYLSLTATIRLHGFILNNSAVVIRHKTLKLTPDRNMWTSMYDKVTQIIKIYGLSPVIIMQLEHALHYFIQLLTISNFSITTTIKYSNDAPAKCT